MNLIDNSLNAQYHKSMIKPIANKLTIIGMLCLKCEKVLVSWFGHDFSQCSCINQTFIDGGQGNPYFRYGGQDINKMQLVLIEPVPTVKKRKLKK